jgi:hypothetical protein
LMAKGLSVRSLIEANCLSRSSAGRTRAMGSSPKVPRLPGAPAFGHRGREGGRSERAHPRLDDGVLDAQKLTERSADQRSFLPLVGPKAYAWRLALGREPWRERTKEAE